ncbi:MAG: hypothetical protein ACXWWP_10455, partial [Candidatus Binatia bacterium]
APVKHSISARSVSVMFLSGGVEVNEDFCRVVGPAFHRFICRRAARRLVVPEITLLSQSIGTTMPIADSVNW